MILPNLLSYELGVGMGIFSRKNNSSARRDLWEEELVSKIYDLVPKSLTETINGEVYNRLKLISHVRVLVAAMLRDYPKVDEELTMFILKAAAALSSDLSNSSIEDAAEHNLDMVRASLMLQGRYKEEPEVLEGIVVFGIAALNNAERHPSYRDILIKMKSIL